MPPCLKTSRGGSDLGLQLFICQLIEFFQKLAGGGVEALIGHDFFSFNVVVRMTAWR
jgi:hypothetical protein